MGSEPDFPISVKREHSDPIGIGWEKARPSHVTMPARAPQIREMRTYGPELFS
jgi:hypothetical protein